MIRARLRNGRTGRQASFAVISLRAMIEHLVAFMSGIKYRDESGGTFSSGGVVSFTDPARGNHCFGPKLAGQVSALPNC